MMKKNQKFSTSFHAWIILILGGFLCSSLVAQSVERGEASYYADQYHAKNKTASGELYDKYDFTAAHRTLPFNTWVRVTNLDNGRSAKVRINDRGPFKPGRIIDVSRIAAETLGMIQSGVARVQVEVISRPKPTQDPAPLPAPSRPTPSSDAPPRVVDVTDLPVVDQFGQPLNAGNEAAAPSVSGVNLEEAERYTPALFRMIAFKEETLGYGIQIGAYFNIYRLLEAMDELSQQGYQNTLVQSSLKDEQALFRILLGPFPNRSDAERVQKSLQRKGKEGLIIDLNTLR